MNSNVQDPEDHDEQMRPEYDFTGHTGIRGKYYQRLRHGYTIQIQNEDGTTSIQHITHPEGTVMLDPDVREYFPDSESVNKALRALIQIIPQPKASTIRETEQ
jgi:hypothetical protein